MKRRYFLKAMSLASAGLSLGPQAWGQAGPQEQRLVVLHTNDTHSRIDPFPAGRTWGGLGGVARRAALIEQLRQENEHVLLLDAGDIFQGTPYFNFFGGEVELKAFSAMGYDAVTLGNHDFDNGLEGLGRMLPHANFPYLVANYDFSGTALKAAFQPYKIFRKGKIKVGVFGLGIELAGLVPEKLYGATRYLDPVETAKSCVKTLRAEGCHLVICLSHLGYEYPNSPKISDRSLAAHVAGIDLIIGGHTHTFLDQAVTVTGPEGWVTAINQVGWAGIRLGRVDFSCKPQKNSGADIQMLGSGYHLIGEKS